MKEQERKCSESRKAKKKTNPRLPSCSNFKLSVVPESRFVSSELLFVPWPSHADSRKPVAFGRQTGHPTDPFTNLEPKNPPIDEFYAVQKHRPLDLEAQMCPSGKGTVRLLLFPRPFFNSLSHSFFFLFYNFSFPFSHFLCTAASFCLFQTPFFITPLVLYFFFLPALSSFFFFSALLSSYNIYFFFLLSSCFLSSFLFSLLHFFLLSFLPPSSLFYLFLFLSRPLFFFFCHASSVTSSTFRKAIIKTVKVLVGLASWEELCCRLSPGFIWLRSSKPVRNGFHDWLLDYFPIGQTAVCHIPIDVVRFWPP